MTLKAFKYEPEYFHYTRVRPIFPLNHCEMMRLIIKYNNYFGIKVVVAQNDFAVVKKKSPGEKNSPGSSPAKKHPKEATTHGKFSLHFCLCDIAVRNCLSCAIQW